MYNLDTDNSFFIKYIFVDHKPFNLSPQKVVLNQIILRNPNPIFFLLNKTAREK